MYITICEIDDQSKFETWFCFVILKEVTARCSWAHINWQQIVVYDNDGPKGTKFSWWHWSKLHYSRYMLRRVHVELYGEDTVACEFYGGVDYQNEWKGRGGQVELLGLILIYIVNDKISIYFRRIKTYKSTSSDYWQLFLSIFSGFQYLWFTLKFKFLIRWHQVGCYLLGWQITFFSF